MAKEPAASLPRAAEQFTCALDNWSAFVTNSLIARRPHFDLAIEHVSAQFARYEAALDDQSKAWLDAINERGKIIPFAKEGTILKQARKAAEHVRNVFFESFATYLPTELALWLDADPRRPTEPMRQEWISRVHRRFFDLYQREAWNVGDLISEQEAKRLDCPWREPCPLCFSEGGPGHGPVSRYLWAEEHDFDPKPALVGWKESRRWYARYGVRTVEDFFDPIDRHAEWFAVRNGFLPSFIFGPLLDLLTGELEEASILLESAIRGMPPGPLNEAIDEARRFCAKRIELHSMLDFGEPGKPPEELEGISLLTSSADRVAALSRLASRDVQAPAPPHSEPVDDPWLSHRDIATRFCLKAEGVRKKLERAKKKLTVGKDWMAAEEPAQRQPRSLYRLSAIAHLFDAAASGERPSRNNSARETKSR